MQLAVYIQHNTEKIAQEWENFAREQCPTGGDNQPLGLRDHINAILTFIAQNIAAPQTKREQFQKSRGHGEEEGQVKSIVADEHAHWRLIGGFTMDQMILEYRALRASIINLWHKQIDVPTNDDLIDLTRFNEAIDQLLSESITYYTIKINHSRQMFLGILGHDLRTPLGAIISSAEIIRHIDALNETQKQFVSLIIDSASRSMEMATNLMDLTQAGLGNGLSVERKRMDIASTARAIVQELRTSHPEQIIMLAINGLTQGDWDSLRMSQIFSNLISNALQYGAHNKPIHVQIDGTEAAWVAFSVHNEGAPIPPADIESMFDSFMRGDAKNAEAGPNQNLGLGLYITKEIVIAHEGTIAVRSSATQGTVFTVRLPRTASTPPAASASATLVHA